MMLFGFLVVEVKEAKNDLDTLKERLQNGVVIFKYAKKDGTERTAAGTLMDKYIADKPKGLREPSPTVFTYWDLEKNEWRCFRRDNFIGIVE